MDTDLLKTCLGKLFSPVGQTHFPINPCPHLKDKNKPTLLSPQLIALLLKRIFLKQCSQNLLFFTGIKDEGDFFHSYPEASLPSETQNLVD